MKTVSERLALIASAITDICRISGTPGVSIGVLHYGEVVHRVNYGYRDVDAELPTDENTIYHIASLTKTFTAVTAGILVDEGHFQWSTPIVKILPKFALRDAYLTQHTTVLDVVSNRIGITSGGSINSHGGNKVWLAKEDLLKTIKTFEVVAGFRSKLQYNNHAFGLIQEIIEHFTKDSFGTFITKRIFEPLGMERSVIIASKSPKDNVAKAYATLDDASPFEIPRPESEDQTSLAAAGGIRSTVNDLLKFYKGLMRAARHEYKSPGESAPDNPIKEGAVLLGGHVPIVVGSEYENSYGGGLARTQLPGVLGSLGLNPLFVQKRPVVGLGCRPALVHWHQGSYPGFLASALLVHETESAVVVLTNSLALNDAADWIAQLVLQTLLGDENSIDFVDLARESRERNIARNNQVAADLQSNRELNTLHRPLQDYTGRYYNSARSFFLEIRQASDGENLEVFFQGQDWDVYTLRHYHHDVFEWHISREEQVKRARWPRMNQHFWKLSFAEGTRGNPDRLTWVIDPLVPTGEIFSKLATAQCNAGENNPLISKNGRESL